jgi:AraC-like DNA-binding protein
MVESSRFDSFTPCQQLQPYVAMLAIQESQLPDTYKVIPGPHLVIGLQYSGRLSYADGTEQISLSTAGITGITATAKAYSNDGPIGSVLIYFKPGGAAVFFNAPLHELFNSHVSLDNFVLRSALLVLEEQLCSARTDTERIAVTEQFLIARMRSYTPDPLVMAAVTTINACRGNIRIKDLAKELHISQSPLEKRFRSIIGTSPRKYATIIRFKYVLDQHRHASSLTKLAYDAGYYDQSHFIKEFRQFTGDAPEQYFSRLG